MPAELTLPIINCFVGDSIQRKRKEKKLAILSLLHYHCCQIDMVTLLQRKQTHSNLTPRPYWWSFKLLAQRRQKKTPWHARCFRMGDGIRLQFFCDL